MTATRPSVDVSVLLPGLTRTRIFESARNHPAKLSAPAPSSFQRTSQAMIASVWDTALNPAKVADAVVHAIRDRRIYVLTHPAESHDMLEQQLRWMKENIPSIPGSGVAHTADT